MSLNLGKYQEFATLLEKLYSDVSITQVDAPTLQQRFYEVQQFFIEKIISLNDLDSREQSYQTEISKQLRLLEIDIVFISGAKKPETVNMRVKNMQNRLKILIGYCQSLMD